MLCVISLKIQWYNCGDYDIDWLIVLTNDFVFIVVDEDNMSDDVEDDWERQQFQKAIRQRQLESAHQEMAMQDNVTEKSTNTNTSVGQSIFGPVREQRTSGSVNRPDLSKLNPLPSPAELQERLRQR